MHAMRPRREDQPTAAAAARWESVVRSSRSTGRLQLRGASLGPCSAQALVRLLLAEERQPWLVDLEGNELGDSGAVCLAELVRQSQDLVWLGLGSNGIGPLGEPLC